MVGLGYSFVRCIRPRSYVSIHVFVKLVRVKFVKFAKQAQKLMQLTCTRVFFNRNNLNQRFASRVNSPEHLQPPMVGRQLWPFPSTSNSFYWPSELTRMQFNEQQLGRFIWAQHDPQHLWRVRSTRRGRSRKNPLDTHKLSWLGN